MRRRLAKQAPHKAKRHMRRGKFIRLVIWYVIWHLIERLIGLNYFICIRSLGLLTSQYVVEKIMILIEVF
jgi:hypothetical protein